VVLGLMFSSLGFGVTSKLDAGSGFRIWGLGIRDQSFGLMVQVSGLKISVAKTGPGVVCGSGFGTWGVGVGD